MVHKFNNSSYVVVSSMLPQLQLTREFSLGGYYEEL